MLVFARKKLAFLCQSKTASSAYQEALAPLAEIVIKDPTTLKHANTQRFDRFIRPMMAVAGVENIQTVAVIREPISWLGSWYRYRTRPFLDGTKNSTKDISFSEFCESYIQDKQPAFANVGSQYRFLFSPNGKHTCQHIFRYENQSGLINFLEARLETKLDIPVSNASPKMDLELDETTENRVRQKLNDEYSLWNSLAADSSSWA